MVCFTVPEGHRIWSSISPGWLTPSRCTDSITNRSSCWRPAYVVVPARQIVADSATTRPRPRAPSLLGSAGIARWLSDRSHEMWMRRWYLPMDTSGANFFQ